MVKCPVCKEQFDREVIKCIKEGRRYYHLECHKKHLQEKESKKNNQETKMSEEEQNRRELIGYIMKLYGLSRINGLMLKQIKDFKEMGYTYIGMKSTLHYFHEIQGNPVVATGIGIIPFVYDEAKQWYINRAIAHKHFDELVEKQGTGNIVSKRTVKIKTKPLKIKKREKIDITSL